MSVPSLKLTRYGRLCKPGLWHMVPIAVRLVEVRGPDGNVLNTAQPWLRYEFAEPALQALPAVQKTQLQAFRAQIATGSQQQGS